MGHNMSEPSFGDVNSWGTGAELTHSRIGFRDILSSLKPGDAVTPWRQQLEASTTKPLFAPWCARANSAGDHLSGLKSATNGGCVGGIQLRSNNIKHQLTGFRFETIYLVYRGSSKLMMEVDHDIPWPSAMTQPFWWFYRATWTPIMLPAVRRIIQTPWGDFNQLGQCTSSLGEYDSGKSNHLLDR